VHERRIEKLVVELDDECVAFPFRVQFSVAWPLQKPSFLLTEFWNGIEFSVGALHDAF
jgi:hypothetical protein